MSPSTVHSSLWMGGSNFFNVCRAKMLEVPHPGYNEVGGWAG
jgi:hypothetical protein